MPSDRAATSSANRTRSPLVVDPTGRGYRPNVERSRAATVGRSPTERAMGRAAVSMCRIGHLPAGSPAQELEMTQRPRRAFVTGTAALAVALVALPAALGSRVTSAAPA